MAITIKRPLPELSQGLKNNTQHFNQMTFKGIVQNNNPFDVDQLSLRDAYNVYVDDHGTLISRPPIVHEPLPNAYIEQGISTILTPLMPEHYYLVDVYETGKLMIYVGGNGANYHIVAFNKDNRLMQALPELVTKYHISAIDNYVIVFNNVDARVLNINRFSDGWSLLRDLAEIPVTKRVVGQETFTFSKNQFTNDYKEEYIWSEGIDIMLPSGEAKINVATSPVEAVWTLPNASLNTEFRLLRPLNLIPETTDIITVATNDTTGVEVLAIARNDHVLISYDYGQSFTRYLYPAHEGFNQVASVSQDGLHFFFVARDGVYQLELGTNEWIVHKLPAASKLNGTGMNNTCLFLNHEVFAFTLKNSLDEVDVYFKGYGLKVDGGEFNVLSKITLAETITPQTTKSTVDMAKHSVAIYVEGPDSDNLITSIVLWLPGSLPSTSTLVALYGDLTDPVEIEVYTELMREYGLIVEAKLIRETDSKHFEITAVSSDNNGWFETELVFGTDLEIDNVRDLELPVTSEGAPLYLETAYIVDQLISSVDGNASLPTELASLNRQQTVTSGRYFYTVIEGRIYTNRLVEASQTKLTYTYRTTTPYTQIPTVSYGANELYLGFDNMLKITANIRSGSTMKFDLPSINDHAFASDITNMINISTDYIAIFLINQIFVSVKSPDDLLGYRYDYLNTRLTTGVRLGDSVMNTRDGQYTLYPTRQGLAVMNYQVDTANTDQIVDYVSRNITKLWTEFYLESSPIEMIQMRDYVFITNNTKRYLLLDLRTMSWWKLESPVVIYKLTTDQDNITIVSDHLYKYQLDHTLYRDLGNKLINWRIESQPNHFNAPNHYKNMKQLVFQFEESTDITQTILAQIRLFRKALTIREPETIGFAVQSYRTFIKRFNYWKINELQWALAYDDETETPAQLRLNGIAVKYEISDEVRS